MDSAVLVNNVLRSFINLIPDLLHRLDYIEGGRPRAVIGPNPHNVCREECRRPCTMIERWNILHLEDLRFGLAATGAAAGDRGLFSIAIDLDRYLKARC
jgi:hypothetical protein